MAREQKGAWLTNVEITLPLERCARGTSTS